MPERMSPYFAVFNFHINDARDKAKKLFVKTFGQEAWDKEIQHYVTNGVMEIFSIPHPDFMVMFYVAAVTMIVNGDVTCDVL